MGRVQAILMPGHYTAKRLNSKYVKFIERVKNRTSPNRSEFIWLFWGAPIMACGMAFAIGAVSNILGLTFLLPAILLMCPVAGGLDMYLWRKVYGRQTKGVGYRTHLLLNLDTLYWCVIGYAVGFVLPI